MSNKINHSAKPADEISDLKVLATYLCFAQEGKKPLNKTIEKRCASCDVRCEYGQRWLDIFWEAEDAAYEKEQAAKKMVEKLSKLRQLQMELEQIRAEKATAEKMYYGQQKFIRQALTGTKFK